MSESEIPDDERVRAEMLRLLDLMEDADDDVALPSVDELRCAAAAQLGVARRAAANAAGRPIDATC